MTAQVHFEIDTKEQFAGGLVGRTQYGSLIVNAMADGRVYRFNELKKKTRYLSSNTLSSILKRLVNDGLVNRLVIPDNPPKTEYSLTEKGLELSWIISDFLAWNRKWNSSNN